MVLSNILMGTGVVTYVIGWIIYFIVSLLIKLSPAASTSLFVYALVPWTAVTAGSAGVALKFFGL